MIRRDFFYYGKGVLVLLILSSFVSCGNRQQSPSAVVSEIQSLGQEDEQQTDSESVYREKLSFDEYSESMEIASNEVCEEEVRIPIEIKGIDDLSRIHRKAKEARIYAKKHKMNDRFCFLLDFSHDLFTKRFFVYDLLNSCVMQTALVCHGYGGGSTESKVVFSNDPGSKCSSLGKYEVGTRGYSGRGIHVNYQLHGLESTNSNAFRRYVVIHSYEYFMCDFPCMVSEGCVIVCDDMMLYLDGLLKTATKPTLLWIFR